MYRPTIQSNFWLGLMTIAFLILFYWSENSRVTVNADNYEAKMMAAKTMMAALETLREYRLPGHILTSTEGVQDPLAYTMLGEKDSPITTDAGRIQDKITVLNPNFAAVIVDLVDQTGLISGDTIAVMVTGSMPGANIAVYSAAKALGLQPIVITSVGSSWWGANSPDFTWLDMERILYEQGIFDFRSIAASAGGSDDQGGLRLTNQGRQLIADAVNRNELTYIHQGSLSENIRGRKELYSGITDVSNYKAVVNVGGGIAALGDHANAELIPNGVSLRLPVKNYPNLGVIHFFAHVNIPVIQLYNVSEIANNDKYKLPLGQLPLQKPGIGKVFKHRRYNIVTAYTALGLMFVILVVVKYFDRKRFQWREEKIDPDTMV